MKTRITILLCIGSLFTSQLFSQDLPLPEDPSPPDYPGLFPPLDEPVGPIPLTEEEWEDYFDYYAPGLTDDPEDYQPEPEPEPPQPEPATPDPLPLPENPSPPDYPGLLPPLPPEPEPTPPD